MVQRSLDALKMSTGTAVTALSLIVACSMSFAYLKSEVLHNKQALEELKSDNKAAHESLEVSINQNKEMIYAIKDLTTEYRGELKHLNERTTEILFTLRQWGPDDDS